MAVARYEHWLGAVSYQLWLLTGRGLEYVPAEITDGMLRCWWRAGVPARVVAQGLSTRVVRVQWTFTRFYTDDPARVIRERAV